MKIIKDITAQLYPSFQCLFQVTMRAPKSIRLCQADICITLPTAPLIADSAQGPVS